MKALFLLVGVSWLLMTEVAVAIDPVSPFEDPILETTYQELINEVRCLVCQNQTIADSNAPLASDLRREIRAMIEQGMPRSEIVEFLVARYGDFVLYRPPFHSRTWILWGAPVFLLFLGFVVFARILKARINQPLTD
tara:strand:+ start:6277 stop:6687 length:411 start_codon:yes stop_codon:yes gene_type:complete